MLTRRVLPLAALGSMLAPKAFAQPLTPPGLSIAGGAVTGPVAFSGGVSFGSVNASSLTDLSKHIALFGTNFGICVTTSNTISLLAGSNSLTLNTSGNVVVSGALRINQGIGFYNTAPVATKPTVSGAKGSNAALASLLTALSACGFVTDSTTA